MTTGWTGDGPVSLPPPRTAYMAGAFVLVLAVLGAGLGFRASLREAPEPGLGGNSSATPQDAVTATPIVELPPPVTAPAPAKEEQASAAANSQEARAKEDLAEQTAEAQAVQAKTSKPSQDIDDILTSASEKPPTPVKPTTDEAPPEKSDVPF